ncbi:MAG: hypothetical protein ACD_47C00013G0004 [uncultured bacterium]|nr:MAG: hypothetical protein ACD_47C00013G0004 [uncultured bacterium]
MPDLSYADVTPIGGELGTSMSKFCEDGRIIAFSSVIGDGLSDSLEANWQKMNRSTDHRWIRNLAIYDDSKNMWRYVGAMSRNSNQINWFTHKGVIQNYADAFIGIQAGLFCLSQEREENDKPPLKKVGIGFGIPVKAGEVVAETFFNYIKSRLKTEGSEKFLLIKAKNVATGEIKELKIQFAFILLQFQAYGAYMSFLMKKFGMRLYNTYVVDVGHGTWIKLPVIENEADINLSDSVPEGIFTVTSNISQIIFESSGQRYKIPEQRIMEKLPRGEYKVEVPGSGVFDFANILDNECSNLCEHIIQAVKSDLVSINRKGKTIDYFAMVGGGASLIFEKFKEKIKNHYNWSDEIANDRVISGVDLGVDHRYVNSVGFMLLARDQIALELEKEVNPDFDITAISTDALENFRI